MKKRTRETRLYARQRRVNLTNHYNQPALMAAGVQTVPAEQAKQWRAEAAIPYRTRNAIPITATAHSNDPAAVTLVLDALLRITNDTVSADQLADLMRDEYPIYDWNPITVGRILGAIYEVSADGGETIYHRARDRWGIYYEVNISQRNWDWLARMRENAAVIARVTGNASTPTLWDDLAIATPLEVTA